MSLRAGAILLLIAAISPNVRYFRYKRPVLNTPAQSQQTCLLLDVPVFAHAGAQFSSLRLYHGDTETPYFIGAAPPVEQSANHLVPLNTGLTNGAVSFDAALPDGTYQNIDLTIDAHDFIATVHVSGSQTQAGPSTSLGSYTIFDFTRQKLGRSTVLHLPESNFRYLHFHIDGPIRPDQITGLSIGHAASEPQYLTFVTAESVQQQGRDSVVTFSVPANVPVDRIVFAPGVQPVNFSRDVTITVTQVTAPPKTDAEEPPPPVITSGNILRIHSPQNGHRIDEEHLAIGAPYQTFNTATRWTIAIHNEDDAPIALNSVALQMIPRSLCFNAQPGASYDLYYGDDSLSVPHYDYASLFVLDKNADQANLGAEQLNPHYESRPDTRPFTEKHPALLWIALIAAIALLGGIALRSSKQIKRP